MKNIIIIGGTDGIGQALAEQLVDTHHVLIVGRNQQKGKAFVTEHGKNAHFIAADISLLARLPELVDQFKTKFKQVDYVVHCADVLTTKRSDTSEGLEVSIAVNYYSRVLINHLLINAESAYHPEKIIHIAAAGFPPGKKFAKNFPPAKTTSAFRAHGYGQMANDFYGLYIRDAFQQLGTQINILNPGMVDTDIRRKGHFPLFFRLLGPLMEFVLSPVMKSPEEYARIPLSILNDESPVARQNVLINPKGKGIKGNRVLNDPDVQRYVYDNTMKTLTELTGMHMEPVRKLHTARS